MPTTPTHVNGNWARDRQKHPPQTSLHYDTAIWENQAEMHCGSAIGSLQSEIRNRLTG
jgi:hypothetical protein